MSLMSNHQIIAISSGASLAACQGNGASSFEVGLALWLATHILSYVWSKKDVAYKFIKSLFSRHS